MLCEHANLILIDYAEGTLDDPTRAEVEQHLEGCDTCQADFSAIHEWRTMGHQRKGCALISPFQRR